MQVLTTAPSLACRYHFSAYPPTIAAMRAAVGAWPTAERASTSVLVDAQGASPAASAAAATPLQAMLMTVRPQLPQAAALLEIACHHRQSMHATRIGLPAQMLTSNAPPPPPPSMRTPATLGGAPSEAEAAVETMLTMAAPLATLLPSLDALGRLSTAAARRLRAACLGALRATAASEPAERTPLLARVAWADAVVGAIDERLADAVARAEGAHDGARAERVPVLSFGDAVVGSAAAGAVGGVGAASLTAAASATADAVSAEVGGAAVLGAVSGKSGATAPRAPTGSEPSDPGGEGAVVGGGASSEDSSSSEDEASSSSADERRRRKRKEHKKKEKRRREKKSHKESKGTPKHKRRKSGADEPPPLVE